jgi:hypothetical protein
MNTALQNLKIGLLYIATRRYFVSGYYRGRRRVGMVPRNLIDR